MVSKDRIEFGIEGGFIHSNQGKAAYLRRMNAGDGIVVILPGNLMAVRVISNLLPP